MNLQKVFEIPLVAGFCLDCFKLQPRCSYMLKPWILLAPALLTCASQANAGEITEADLQADEIILAKKILANFQTYQPEVKAWLADYEKKLEADKWHEIDLIEQA